MDIALPAVVIFLILFPGFLARARFKLVKNESLDYSPFGKTLAEAFIWALILHALWISVSIILFNRFPIPDTFLHLFTSYAEVQSTAISAVAQDWHWVTIYFLTLILACLIIPPWIQGLISKFRLDNYPILEKYFHFSDAEWYYLLEGRDEPKIPDMVYVSAILLVNNEATLYDGILSDYVMDSEGKLDYLVLSNVTRWNLEDFDKSKNNQELQATAYSIDGNYFVLRYSETVTLNIRYVFFDDFLSSEES